MSNFVRFWIEHKPYEKVFFFPANEELLKKYGKKDKDLVFLREIEKAYLMHLDSYNINHVILPKDQEAQIKYISKDLEDIVDKNAKK